MVNKILGMLGLAARAGRIAGGEFSVEKMIKMKHARLVIVAQDSSDTTKKLFRNKCTHYRVPLYFYSDKETLGHAVGKEARASIAVLDDSFAKAVRGLLLQEGLSEQKSENQN